MRRDEVHHFWVPGTPTALGDGEVHIWAASMNLSPRELAQMRDILSTDELARCERSPLPAERNRFVAGRGLLRHILAPYLRINPADIQFAYGFAGKPYLADDSADIEFNISHSGDLALIAVAEEHEVGVDVERICEIQEIEEIAMRFFSEPAKAQFQAAAAEDRLQVFYRCWTEKEALSKCTGQGIAEEEPILAENICVIPLHPAFGYTAALATSGPSLKLHTWRWQQASASVATEHNLAAATGVFL
jgi:4'-phosphopantetheinyl transferase